jgi:hypothetical protein
MLCNKIMCGKFFCCNKFLNNIGRFPVVKDEYFFVNS